MVSNPSGIVIVSKLVPNDFLLSHNSPQSVFYRPFYFSTLLKTFVCGGFNQTEVDSLFPPLEITLFGLFVDDFFGVSAWQQF